MPVSDAELDLTNCDREPIHIPGAIQPHGVLLIVDPTAGTLAGQAGDATPYVGQRRVSPSLIERLVGCSISALAERIPENGSLLLGSFGGHLQRVDAVAHRSGHYVILELEASDSSALGAGDALGLVQSFAARLESAHDGRELAKEAARAVRRLTGYERIMVYRFLPDGAGTVVAESKAEDIPSLLNHHFPASDIPRQARQLYARNLVRVIPDARYVPAQVEWFADGQPDKSLDMSDCHLRSVSPIHLQYLINMGVAASASISVMSGGELWGLIACHNRVPRHLGFVHREIGKHIGQLLGSQVAARQRSEVQLEVVRLGQRRDELLSFLTGIGTLEESMERHPDDLMRIIPSDGVAVCNGGRIALAGSAPRVDQVEMLLQALPSGLGEPFATHRLVDLHQGAAEFAAAASGALFCLVRRDPILAIVWFRAEQVETVNWAGNPHKAVEGEAGALTPRKSFDLWRETVTNEARRWSAAEIDAADRLRSALLQALDQQELQRLNQQLRRTLGDKEELIAQKDLLMREVHHRVQNSLQLVNAMLSLQEREAGSEEVRTQFERARQRLTAVAMVHRRLWRSDKIGDVRLETFLAELTDELVKVWGGQWRGNIKLDAAPISLSTDKGIIVGLIVTELTTNAVKYAYGGVAGPIGIEAKEAGSGRLTIAVSDRGPGLQPKPGSHSFGSKLVETLVRQLGGTLEIQDNVPGVRAVFSFPLGR